MTCKPVPHGMFTPDRHGMSVTSSGKINLFCLGCSGLLRLTYHKGMGWILIPTDALYRLDFGVLTTPKALSRVYQVTVPAWETFAYGYMDKRLFVHQLPRRSRFITVTFGPSDTDGELGDRVDWTFPEHSLSPLCVCNQAHLSAPKAWCASRIAGRSATFT